ncbi:MAG: elongation factor Ts [Rhodospirillaceae bacterium]|jgi:elongation factor Ts|nr:elongation factor Ts [Rhodospirillaceae bacterium]
MAEITASLVKELRESTGAGMMDCKKALSETDGVLEDAVDWLRKKGLSSAAKKAGRVAAEGLVALHEEGRSGAIVEVNSETDFVARNESFQKFAATVASLATSDKIDDIEALGAAAYPGADRSVGDELIDMVATIGENMSLRRVARLEVSKGVVTGYVHAAAAPGLGRIVVLVALESDGDETALRNYGKQIAMHIAAASPQSISKEDLDPALVERERNILADQARATGKPEEIIEKMLVGRLRKYYEEVVLLEQTYVIDGESKVSEALEAASKECGGPIKITGFVRFALGEGIERKEEDFAAEVAAAAGN